MRKKKCSYYFELESIFREHASINPPMASDDLEADLSHVNEKDDHDDDIADDDIDDYNNSLETIVFEESEVTFLKNPTPKKFE